MIFSRRPSPVAQAIIDSLREHPEKWRLDDDDRLMLGNSFRLFFRHRRKDCYISSHYLMDGILADADERAIYKAAIVVYRNLQRQARDASAARFLDLLKQAEGEP